MRKRYSAKFKAEIVQEVLQENKTIAEIASDHGIHPNQIYRWKEIALKGLPSLFNDDAKAAKAAEADQEKKLDEFYAQIERLTTQLHSLEKNLALTLSRAERLALVEREPGELPLTTQCDLLSLNRTGLYYQPLQHAELFRTRTRYSKPDPRGHWLPTIWCCSLSIASPNVTTYDVPVVPDPNGGYDPVVDPTSAAQATHLQVIPDLPVPSRLPTEGNWPVVYLLPDIRTENHDGHAETCGGLSLWSMGALVAGGGTFTDC